MTKIRITKEFHFEMSHALWNYDGKCKNIHGHTYKLFVTVIGEPIDDEKNPKYGMVMDFSNLKKIVNKYIIDTHDHYIAVKSDSPHGQIEFENYAIENVQRKNYQPTCENMVIEFVDILKKHLPQSVKLHSIRLYETPTSYAEWYAEDNK